MRGAVRFIFLQRSIEPVIFSGNQKVAVYPEIQHPR